MNKGNQGYRGWLERSIFNILQNQENVTHELSKNVSKATAGKCIRDTGAVVFTGDAVGHLATIWSRQCILEAAYTRLSSCARTTLSSSDTVKTWGTVQYRPMDFIYRGFVHACHCSVVRVKVNLAFLCPERWTLLKLLSCSTQGDQVSSLSVQIVSNAAAGKWT